jgi:hypothetical protein
MSNIITPDSVKASSAAQEKETQQVEHLNKYEAERLLGAFARLHELEDQKVITPNFAAEYKGIQLFITNSLLKVGPQLLGSYLTLKGEYEPFVLTFSLFFRRVLANVNMMEAQSEQHEKARLAAVRAEAEKNGPPAPSPEAAALKAKVDAATK